MSKFNDFIFESLGPVEQFKKIKLMNEGNKDEDSDLNVLVLTTESKKHGEGLFQTASRVGNECKKMGIPSYILLSDTGKLERNEDGSYTAYNLGDTKGFHVHPDKTIALNRGSSIGKFNSRNIISQLERGGIFCINNRKTIETCSDKYRTILNLADAGVDCPKTVLIQGERGIEDAVEYLGNEFPYIVKTLQGSQGVGVILVESIGSLRSMLQLIWKVEADTELLLQEYIKAEFDVRAHVLGDEVISAMKRYVIEDDFRSNYSQGGKIEAYELSDEEKEICIKASKSTGALWGGVDYIIKDDKPLVIEVNSSPGTEGIEKATKTNIVGKVLSWASDRKNWEKVAKEIGWREMMKVNGHDLIAKFDTGNGVDCVLHADKYTIDEENKTIKWITHGKKFDSVYNGIKKVWGAGKESEQRPRTILDITFDNVLYKDVEFTLDERIDVSPILVNRKFMRRANVCVNPDKTFAITVKEE